MPQGWGAGRPKLVSRLRSSNKPSPSATRCARNWPPRSNAQVAADSLRISAGAWTTPSCRHSPARGHRHRATRRDRLATFAGGGYTRTGIGTIVDMDSLEVEVEVGEAFIGQVKPGMPTETVLNAWDWKIGRDRDHPTADRGRSHGQGTRRADAKGGDPKKKSSPTWARLPRRAKPGRRT